MFALVNDTQDGRPPAPPAAWKAVRPELKSSPLATSKLRDNTAALAAIQAAIAADPTAEVQLAIVPGSSEALGHHTAWQKKLDGHWVEPEFRARLRHAYLLLEQGIVKGLFISGGPVDDAQRDYVEALAGARELVETYGARWRASPRSKGGRLEDRVLVDGWAIHSEDNVRNGDRTALLLGLDRDLVVTTAGKHAQGWWFTHHAATATLGPLSIRWGSFDKHCQKALGYTLGAFGGINQGDGGPFGTGANTLPRLADLPKGYAKAAKKYLAGKGNNPSSAGGPVLDTVAIAHWRLNGAVLQDAHWSLGQFDTK